MQELWDHVPTTRKRKSEYIHQSLLDANPACSSNVDATTNFIQTNPTHYSRKITDVDHTTPPDRNNVKVRWYTNFVHVNNFSSNPKNPMPIGIHKYLPSLSLILGSLEDEENKMRMLVNTGSAINTGNLRFHM